MSASADDVQTAAATTEEEAEQATVAGKRLAKFAAAHGGAQHVYVEHVSASRTRVVVVAQDGRWGDQVVDSPAAAHAACARAGFEVTTGEWSREAVGSVRTTAFEWGLMGRGRPAAK